MDLLDLFVKIGVDDQASSKVASIAGKITGTLGKAAGAAGKVAATATKAVAAGVAAVSAGVAAVGAQSMSAYSAYEQNVGGIQKIFGNMGKSLEDYAALTGQTVEACAEKWQILEDSQSRALANADKAWQTAGLSANAYMEQVTGFSAALVASLGGDTQKAVDYADMAIVDMSDNANTFGTDMESIQWAYQGFAKQNYTMLDNLKLGYGGTKEEMERLISDASKLTDVQERLGVSVDESSMSFENIVAAIHVMQESMQIGGTTAREAATTIEGSVNSMKAAWSNWVTELGKDDADMAKLTDELVESFETAAKNVVPRVGVIVGTAIGQLPALIAELGPVVVDSVGQIGEQAIGALRDSVSADNPMADLVFGVTNALEEVERRLNGFKSLWSMGENPVQSFSLAAEYALNLLNGDLEALTGNSNFADAVTNALRTVGDFAASAADGVGQLAERFDAMGALDAAASVLNTLAEFIGRVADQAGEYLMPVLDSAGEALSELFSAVAQAQEWLQPLADFLADVLVAALQIVVAALIAAVDVVTLLVNAVNEFAGFIMGVPASVQSFVDQVGALFGQLPGLIGGFLASAVASVGAWALQTAAQAAQAGSQFLSGVDSFFGQLPSSVAGFLAQVVSRVGSWAGEMASGAQQAASDFASGLLDRLASLPGEAMSAGRSIVQGLIDGITGMISAAGDAIGSVVDTIASYLPHSPAKRGAFSGKGWTPYSGRAIVHGLAQGIAELADEPADAMAAVMDGVSATTAVSNAAVNGVASVNASSAGGTTPEGAAAVIAWLGENLPAIIEQYTPTMGEDEFGRKARKAVAYA